MSRLSRLVDMAKKALSESDSSNRSHGQGAPRSSDRDWGALARSAMDAVKGGGADGRGSADPRGPVAEPRSAGYAPPPAADRYAPPPAPGTGRPASAGTAPLASSDRAAIARYDYLLQTADPRQVEQIHREAFARLTPAQRAHVEERMRAELPPGEHPRSADPADLARSATRSEMMRPGSVRGLLARVGGGSGRGRAVGGAALGAAGGVLAAVAGGAVLSAVAAPLLDQAAGIDFDALGAGIDLEGIAGGVEGLAGGVEGAAGDLASGVSDQVSGFGDQLGGLGDQISGFGLGDLFGR